MGIYKHSQDNPLAIGKPTFSHVAEEHGVLDVKHIRTTFPLLFVLFFVVACGGAPTPGVTLAPSPATITEQPTVLPTNVPSTATPQPPTATPAPTLTASPSSAPTATTTITSTPVPSPVEFVSIITGNPNPFDKPFSIAFDGKDNLYVADSGNDRIQIFNPFGKFITMWSKKGSGDGEFNFHRASQGDAIGSIAIDAQGNIYVADTGNARIQKFDSKGKFLNKWGTKGTKDGQFSDPLFIAVDRQGNVYVDDDDRDDIQKFDPTGKFITHWGGHGLAQGQFDGPGELAVDAQGNVYVVDFGNNRVQKFDSNGKFLLAWGSHGGQPGQFDQPSGVAIDGQNNVYISNGGPEHGPDHHWVQKFTSDGKFLGRWGSFGTGDGEFIHPYGLGINGKGNVFVVDTNNDRIQEFHPSSTVR